MRVFAFLMMVACGGGNPIDACLSNQHDCCEFDRDCSDFYGNEAPYCVDPGPVSGTCSECTEDYHCDAGRTCVIEDSFGVCVEAAG